MITARERENRGWAFPIRFLATAQTPGLISTATIAEDENLRQSLALILQITPGERPLLPSFGCDLSRFVFERFDLSLGAAIGSTVRRAIDQWETRIAVEQVEVALAPGTNDRELIIAITYLVRASRRRARIDLPYTLGGANAAPSILLAS